MKRIFKIMLSLLVILSGITVTTSMTATPVIARTVGGYTYTDNSDGTVTITNYGGSERDLTIPEVRSDTRHSRNAGAWRA